MEDFSRSIKTGCTFRNVKQLAMSKNELLQQGTRHSRNPVGLEPFHTEAWLYWGLAFWEVSRGIVAQAGD